MVAAAMVGMAPAGAVVPAAVAAGPKGGPERVKGPKGAHGVFPEGKRTYDRLAQQPLTARRAQRPGAQGPGPLGLMDPYGPSPQALQARWAQAP